MTLPAADALSKDALATDAPAADAPAADAPAADAPAASEPAGAAARAALVRRRRWLAFGLLAVWGPGLLVMLADTDAGSLITAAQSGAQWGYRMILPQLVLIPILFAVQEMTVRLGIVTQQGHGALIRERFGRGWALLSAGTLFASGVGALLTEFAGVAGVGQPLLSTGSAQAPAVTLKSPRAR
jgi:Mn2+/Fe2+ NRAMP family transporter